MGEAEDLVVGDGVHGLHVADRVEAAGGDADPADGPDAEDLAEGGLEGEAIDGGAEGEGVGVEVAALRAAAAEAEEGHEGRA